MITTNALNVEFRYLAANSTYPFVNSATYTDISGRQLPYSSFIDCIIYPIKMLSEVYINKIFYPNKYDFLCLELASDNIPIGYAYNIEDGANYVFGGPFNNAHDNKNISGNDIIIGCIVIKNAEYLRGLAETSNLLFKAGDMKVLPTRIEPVKKEEFTFTFNDVNIKINTPLEIVFKGDRFSTLTDGNSEAIIFDNKILNKYADIPIRSINGRSFSNQSLWLYTTKYEDNEFVSDIRISTSEDGIELFRIGDDV